MHPKAGSSASLGYAYGLLKHWGRKQLPTWVIHQKCGSVAGLVSLPDGYPTLVGGTHHHSQGGGSKEAGPKICASFSIPDVRCETFLGQQYTMPPAPRCLTRGRFIPNDPFYQDIQQQPLLMTVAYAQALQYWAGQIRLPVHSDYHPLAMSIVELMWQVRGHITFYTWDIFWNLERVSPETVDRDLAIPQGHPFTQPTPINIGGMKSSSVEAWRAHNTTPSLPKEEVPPVESIPLSTAVDVDHTPPGPADVPLERDAMPVLVEPEVEVPKGLPTSQATSPIGAVAQIVPTTDQWSSWQAFSSHQTRPKTKAVCANCNCLGKEVKSGDNWVYPRRICDHLSRGSGLWEPLNGSSSSWTHQSEEGDGHPRATVEEITGKNLERSLP